jgi:3-keto-5-aminohexanoate cleavage enzyme
LNNATPLIIEAAINGATPKDRNPHVPRTVDEIVESALACLDAGAAIVHNHNDEPNVGGPGRHASEPYAAAWSRILERYPDAILYPTYAGGGPHTHVRERYAHIDELRLAGLLRVPLLDPGTTNFDGLGPDGAPGTGDAVYQNTFGDVRWMMDYCREHRLAPSVSIFEPGWLRLALAYHARGELPRGALIKLYFGGGGRLLFGLPPTRASLDAYLAMLDGTGLSWLVAVLGGDVVADGLARFAIEHGGHVRVGLEDYDGPRVPRNEDLVREVVALAAAAGRPVAAPGEAAEILDLPG